MVEYKLKYNDKITHQDVAQAAKSLFQGLQQLHEEFFVMHMDIKPGNFVYVRDGLLRGRPKYIDFDSAVFMDTPIALRISDEYTCKEQAEWYFKNAGKPIEEQTEFLANYRHDIYSLGMVVLFMFQPTCTGESMLVDELDGERGSAKRKETLLCGRYLSRLKSKVLDEAILKFLEYCLDNRLKAR